MRIWELPNPARQSKSCDIWRLNLPPQNLVPTRSWPIHSLLFTGCSEPCWPLLPPKHGGPQWLTAGPVPSLWHTMLGWCPLWKPLECKWPLYDRSTTSTFPKGTVCCGSPSTDFPTRILEQVQFGIATDMRKEQMTMEWSNSPSPFPLQPFDFGGSALTISGQESCSFLLN